MQKNYSIKKSVMARVYDTLFEKSFSHKYIRKVPNSKGGFYYVYPKDFARPVKALLSLFGMKEEKIDNAYAENNIEADYGETKKGFAAHVLEYLTNRKAWNKFFADKFNRDRFKNPEKTVKPATKKEEKAENQSEAEEKKITNEKKSEVKNKTAEGKTEKKSKWNKSLMRKIYSMYNDIPEDKSETNNNSVTTAGTGTRISHNGRTGTIVKDYGNGFVFVNFDNGGMGRFKKTDLQNLEPTNQEVTDQAAENADNQTVNTSNEAVQEELKETNAQKPEERKEIADVPKADDVYTLKKDDKFNSWKIYIKGGYDPQYNKDVRTLYVSNQKEGEAILKKLKKYSLEELQKKGLTAESVNKNIDYDVLIADAEKALENIKNKAADLRAKQKKFDLEIVKPVSDKVDQISRRHGEIRTKIDELKKQLSRFRLADKKAAIQKQIDDLNADINTDSKELNDLRKEWNEKFDESRRMGDDIRIIEESDVTHQKVMINYLKKAKESQGIAVKDLTDLDKLVKVYDMLNSVNQGANNYSLRCGKEDFKPGDKLYYVNPYDLTVQECVVKEVDTKGGAYGWERGVTFANKVGNGNRYDSTFVTYDRISVEMVHADGSQIGHFVDYSGKGITTPVMNDNEYQEWLNRHNAMLGNQNAKKDGLPVEEITKEAGKIESDKIEFKNLVDRYNELNKEFKANGGYSSRHTTSEQDIKRKSAKGLKLKIMYEK